jgi:alkylhydroperoxidase/carboxymuconolactone decarboxylase family protein YurZ
MKKKRKSNVQIEKTKFYDDVLKARGFRLGLHQVMAEADWDFMQRFEEWVKYVYLGDRHLDKRVKELVITGILCALRSPAPHIKVHMKKAVEAGATKEEIIVVAQLAGHWGGTVAQANALEAWRLQFAPKLAGIFEPLGKQK